MKLVILSLLAALISAIQADEIILRDGSKFSYTSVVKIERDGIKVAYADGIKRIPFEKLSDADRDKYSLTIDDVAKFRGEESLKESSPSAAAPSEEAKQETPAAEDHKEAAPKTPRLVTIEQVKAYWIRFFPEPSSLERNAKERKEAYARLIKVIQIGKYDNEAEEKALVWNISEHERCSNVDAANRLREDLKAVRLKIVEERKIALQRQESDRNAVNTAVSLALFQQMQAQLSAMNYTIRQSR